MAYFVASALLQQVTIQIGPYVISICITQIQLPLELACPINNSLYQSRYNAVDSLICITKLQLVLYYTQSVSIQIRRCCIL